MRVLRALAMAGASALVGLVVLWTVGPHSKPASADHWSQVLVFLIVVVICLGCTRRVWDRRPH